MNCRSAEPLLSAFLEDELSQKERRSMETHLLACRRCSLAARELRATVELMEGLPLAETNPHFEEDLLARIRSGEGLRPTVVEWVRGLLEPAKLRPLFLAGAGACAVWIAVVLAAPHGFFHRVDQTGIAVKPSLESTPNSNRSLASAPKGSPDASQQVVASLQSSSGRNAMTVAGHGAEGVSRSLTTPIRSASAPGYVWADGEFHSSRTAQDSTIPNPGSRYDDEYITDQFFLQRGLEASKTPAITPVSDRASDDVYIEF
jgi:hypothetical protein